MNIFAVDMSPKKAAESLCDRHVVKMILESAQLLCTAHPQNQVPYKHTHYNHPSAKWVRQSFSNYCWLYVHALSLCAEYEYRYGKIHKCKGVILNLPCPNLPEHGLTKFALAMPLEFKQECPVASYQAYYRHKQKTIDFRFTRRSMPQWLS